jgi:cytochrome P450
MLPHWLNAASVLHTCFTEQAVLQQRPTVFSRSPCVKQVFAEEGLQGLLTADGDNWTRQRRVTTTAMRYARQLR